MADKEDLRNEYLQNVLSQRKSFWTRVAAVEVKIGKHLEGGYTSDEFLRLLSELNISQIGTFYVNKHLIVQYLRWLQENGHAEAELNIDELQDTTFEDIEFSNAIRGTYFKDFDTLQQLIDEAVLMADKPDPSVHDTVVSIIYLAWCGVTIDEAVTIRKQDLKPINNMVYIPHTDRLANVSDKVMDFLVEYKNATNFQTRARHGARMQYKETPMLLRTPKSSCLSVQNVKNILSRFSKYAKEDTKFYYSRIRQSGIFSRVYEGELADGELVKNDYDKLAEVFGEDFSDYHDASDQLREYQAWKAMFYLDD